MPHTGCAPGAFQAGKLAGRTVYDFLGLENSGFHFSLSHLLIFIPSASPPRLLPTIDTVSAGRKLTMYVGYNFISEDKRKVIGYRK